MASGIDYISIYTPIDISGIYLLRFIFNRDQMASINDIIPNSVMVVVQGETNMHIHTHT